MRGESGPVAPVAESVGCTRRFGEFVAVDDVDLVVAPGEVVGLLGANGAGKTTLIRLLLGLLHPSAGEVRLFGEPPSIATRGRLGYVPQSLGLYDDLIAAENLAFHRAVFGSARVTAPGRRRTWPTSPTSPWAACRWDSSAAWPWWPRSGTVPTCWCSTSRHRASARWPGPGCGRRSARPPTGERGCSSPPTRWRRPRSATAWRSWPPAGWSPRARWPRSSAARWSRSSRPTIWAERSTCSTGPASPAWPWSAGRTLRVTGAGPAEVEQALGGAAARTRTVPATLDERFFQLVTP